MLEAKDSDSQHPESGHADSGQSEAERFGARTPLTFERDPVDYRHWKLSIDAPIATLRLDVDPGGALMGEYELKLNSYDIGVDIELADAIRRLRFEHPEVRCVVIDSAIEGTFCAGANIGMLAAADHGHKINFCKYTNETRLEIEEASMESGLRFLAAIRGACSGGGYELAMACDHLLLIDDRSSAVSLPEIPLLGVLPGTGGLTRLTDKRHVRRDLADVFALKVEGLRGADALAWGLVDETALPSAFDEALNNRAVALAATSDRDAGAAPVVLAPLNRQDSPQGLTYRYVTAEPNRATRSVKVTIRSGPDVGWPLQCARELDDLLCHLRFNEPDLGAIVIGTEGTADEVLAFDAALANPQGHAERETALLWRRVLSRLDLTARSIVALVQPGSCFVGVLAELALAADRTYMLDGIFEDADDSLPAATIQLTGVNAGAMPMLNGLSRLESRFWGDDSGLDAANAVLGESLLAERALNLGLVTIIPDDLDWDDDVRLAIEERASFSPDALTGMEANHRFCGPETMATKIFGRLSAWQNWIFLRPNAGGPTGALSRYGTGTRPEYDRSRT